MLASVYLCYKMTTSQNSNAGTGQGEGLSPARQNKTNIWASMGLCYSHNTGSYGKKNYPYKQVLPLALLLWRYHLPQVKTIVRLVHTEAQLGAEMRSYGAMLERTGALVDWLPAGKNDCVTSSQLVRSQTDILTTIMIIIIIMILIIIIMIIIITAGCLPAITLPLLTPTSC